MKYETPELTALTPAINAIQGSKGSSGGDAPPPNGRDSTAAYEDWED
jgi:hypothetical protein